jgi:expansin (peptidoglycan-binding protein)
MLLVACSADTSDSTPSRFEDGTEPYPNLYESTYSGDATYYDAEGTGACGIRMPRDYLVAAINDEQYSRANCGRCVRVRGPRGSVVVQVVDKCPGCDRGDLDLSQTAFKRIANMSDGRVGISWSFVDCN